mgnify:CR=1 FL=1
MVDKITEFQGEYRFLSNFWQESFSLAGMIFPTAEHAYQALKSNKGSDWQTILRCGTPGQAKRAGRRVTMRDDWNEVKLEIMKDIVRSKFYSNQPLRKRLLATGDAILEEGNKWNDRYWGVCRGVGKNHLGNILMEVREELRDE